MHESVGQIWHLKNFYCPTSVPKMFNIINVDYVKHFRYGGGYDLASRRKNATRESTATLKAWLSEHKKNPYPTKGEKIMLAIITKSTLTQVRPRLRGLLLLPL